MLTLGKMKTTVCNSSESTNTTVELVNREDHTAALVTAIVLILLGLLGNGFIWVSFFLYRRIRTLTNYFIVNLATADVLQVLTLVCWIVFTVIRPDLPQIVTNYMLVSLDILCSSASMLSLAAVSLDRHYAITYSLQYRSIVTAERTIGCVVAIWLYSATVCGLSWSRSLVKSKFILYNKVYITSLVAFSFVLPMATILYCYFKVFKATWIQMKKIKNHRSILFNSKRIIKLEKVMKGEIRLSLNILIILAPMMAFWGTFYCITAYEAYCSDCLVIPPKVDLVVSYAPYFVATINPIVYIFLTRSFRKLLCKTISRFIGKPRLRLVENRTASSLLSSTGNKESREERSSLGKFQAQYAETQL